MSPTKISPKLITTIHTASNLKKECGNLIISKSRHEGGGMRDEKK